MSMTEAACCSTPATKLLATSAGTCVAGTKWRREGWTDGFPPATTAAAAPLCALSACIGTAAESVLCRGGGGDQGGEGLRGVRSRVAAVAPVVSIKCTRSGWTAGLPPGSKATGCCRGISVLGSVSAGVTVSSRLCLLPARSSSSSPTDPRRSGAGRLAELTAPGTKPSRDGCTKPAPLESTDGVD